MDQLRRAIYSTQFLAAALLGMIWYSITAAIKFSGLAILLVVAAPFFIVGTGIAVGQRTSGPSRQPAVALGIFASLVVAVLYPTILVGIGIYLLATSFTAPLLGFIKGWNEGFEGICAGGLELLPGEERIMAFLRRATTGTAASIGRVEADLERATNASIRDQVRNSDNPSIDIRTFAMFALTPQDYAALTLAAARLPPLSETEMQRISDINDPDVSQALAEYKERKAYLKKGECSILLDKPDARDTILLVKQYLKDKEWLAVPTQSWIFDRDSLRDSCTKGELAKGQNPLNRDNIINPPLYDGYKTRYIFHPFYAGSKEVSQEFNQRISLLRATISPTGSATPDLVHDDDLDSSMVFRKM